MLFRSPDGMLPAVGHAAPTSERETVLLNKTVEFFHAQRGLEIVHPGAALLRRTATNGRVSERSPTVGGPWPEGRDFMWVNL